MYISRIFIRNFRNFAEFDVRLRDGVTCIIGENNTGKTNLLHAIRLALDANLSSYSRQLTEHDIHAGIDLRSPGHVVISLEFQDYSDKPNECALVGCWEVAEGPARLTFRFRPKLDVREALQNGERQQDLTLDDYHWELTGGGPIDPKDATWSDDLGSSVRFSDLQAFQVVFLGALRDVEGDLRRSRTSPLDRLFSASEIPTEEKDGLIQILREANDQIASSPTVAEAGSAIQSAFANTAGDAFFINVRLGVSDPTFASIARSLTVLLSNAALTDFDPSRNGLGLNNILYISMLLKYFERRVSQAKAAGQLLMVEEPEAHLHPQLQRTLYGVLRDKPFQTIITTHSTHVSSVASLDSVVVLTNPGTPATACARPSDNPSFAVDDIADLERYLDATRSTLLYARKVLLVEGPAELLLLPPLVKKVMGHDFDRLGISVVPIFGTHFDVYAKMFCDSCLPKRCAIVADGDLTPSEGSPADDDEDESPSAPDLTPYLGTYVRLFQCRTTFERALTTSGTLAMFAKTAEEAGFPKAAKVLAEAHRSLTKNKNDEVNPANVLRPLRRTVLSCARRVGKARFAQIAARHVGLATSVPRYIRLAVEWLVSP